MRRSSPEISTRNTWKTRRNQVKTKTQGFRNYESSIKFATSYIFVLFSSSICGYFVGKEVFGLGFHNRMIFAVICCYVTLMVEVAIFIIKSNKHNQIQQRKDRRKKNK